MSKRDELEIDIKQELLAALDTAIRSYREFIAAGPQEEESKDGKITNSKKPTAKTFQSYHAAGKVAIGHIELLMKSARMLGVSIPPKVGVDVQMLLAQAQAESDLTPKFGHDDD
jgi:hypothetical protein